MIAVQTLERPMRAISSNTEPRLKVCSATAARRAERRSPKTPGRFSTGLHTGAEEIIETLALIAEGSRVASLSRVKGYKEETIRNWLQQAAEHATEIENVLMSEYEIERGQLDALWSYVGHKEQESGEGKKDPPERQRLEGQGVYWRSTMIDIDTRLRVGRGIAKTETEASEEVFRTLRQKRGHPEIPPPTISDGWGGIRDAMVQIWGKVPEYKGRGRPPEKKRPQEGWKYLQVIKKRNEKGRVTGTKPEVIFGEEEDVLGLFENHTAYVERTHPGVATDE
nr:hypothetical protein [Salinibacter ruber]